MPVHSWLSPISSVILISRYLSIGRGKIGWTRAGFHGQSARKITLADKTASAAGAKWRAAEIVEVEDLVTLRGKSGEGFGSRAISLSVRR
jgi:hypothetical protein